MTRKHSHYFKELPPGTTHVDVYMVLRLFNVTDQAVGHALKKLLVPGRRGVKDETKDIQEAVDTLQRKLAIDAEFAGVAGDTVTDPDFDASLAEMIDGWAVWPGGDSPPVAGDTIVAVQYRGGGLAGNAFASGFDWKHRGGGSDVVAYRVAPS